MASTRLPGRLHGDPAGRLIAATARHLGVALVTADEKLLAWGAAGHLAVIPATQTAALGPQADPVDRRPDSHNVATL